MSFLFNSDVLQCIYCSSGFVASMYLFPENRSNLKNFDRDSPRVIKRRLISMFLSCAGGFLIFSYKHQQKTTTSSSISDGGNGSGGLSSSSSFFARLFSKEGLTHLHFYFFGYHLTQGGDNGKIIPTQKTTLCIIKEISLAFGTTALLFKGVIAISLLERYHSAKSKVEFLNDQQRMREEEAEKNEAIKKRQMEKLAQKQKEAAASDSSLSLVKQHSTVSSSSSSSVSPGGGQPPNASFSRKEKSHRHGASLGAQDKPNSAPPIASAEKLDRARLRNHGPGFFSILQQMIVDARHSTAFVLATYRNMIWYGGKPPEAKPCVHDSDHERDMGERSNSRSSNSNGSRDELDGVVMVDNSPLPTVNVLDSNNNSKSSAASSFDVVNAEEEVDEVEESSLNSLNSESTKMGMFTEPSALKKKTEKEIDDEPGGKMTTTKILSTSSPKKGGTKSSRTTKKETTRKGTKNVKVVLQGGSDEEFWVWIRNYVACPFAEEMFFRSLFFELLLLQFKFPSSSSSANSASVSCITIFTSKRAVLISATLFGLSHTHHLVRYYWSMKTHSRGSGNRRNIDDFIPNTPHVGGGGGGSGGGGGDYPSSSPSFSRWTNRSNYNGSFIDWLLSYLVDDPSALKRALIFCTADFLVTFIFGLYSGVLFNKLKYNAVATALAHSYCNFLGPPSLGFVQSPYVAFPVKGVVSGCYIFGVIGYFAVVNRL